MKPKKFNTVTYICGALISIGIVKVVADVKARKRTLEEYDMLTDEKE